MRDARSNSSHPEGFPLKHRLLTILSVLSLLLGIGLGCLWERSMRVEDWVTYIRSSDQRVRFVTYPRQFGFIVYITWGIRSNDPVGWSYQSRQFYPQGRDSFLEVMWEDSWLGFKLFRHDYPVQDWGMHVTSVMLPLWFPMVLTLIAPLCWLRRWRRQARRVRLGLCLHCGYDLRATPAPTGPRLPRCPECGRES